MIAFSLNVNHFLKYDILSSLTPECKKISRNIIVQTILGTDNAVHFQHLNHFKSRKAAEDFDPKSKDKLDLLSLILHSADLSNSTRPQEYSRKWTARVTEEFFNQGDKERELGLPISNFCDKYCLNLAQSQVGFFDFFCKPFFSEVSEAFKGMSFTVGNIELNVDYWRTQVKKCQKELEELIASRQK